MSPTPDDQRPQATDGAGVADTTLYRLLAHFAELSGVSLADPSVLGDFSESLGVQLQAAASNPILRFGVHAEAMFEWIVHALGQTVLLQTLDRGTGAVVDGEQVASPDFLIATRSGKRLVVEVKNCASKSSPPRKNFHRDYLERLVAYASALDAEAKVAIFWTYPGLWTLLDAEYLLSTSDGERIRIVMFDALAESEMATLGDVWVHLRPYPFRFRLDFDILDSQPSSHGTVTMNFRVANATMALGAEALTGQIDSRVVWYLALYGMDVSGGDELTYDSESTAHVEFVAGDDAQTLENQMFSIGPLSTVLVRQYRTSSCDDGGRISGLPFVDVTNDHPARLLANGFQGDDVGFVYFTLVPRHASAP